MNKVWIVHSNRYEDDYEDEKIVNAYSLEKVAIAKVEQLWNSFVLENNIDSWCEETEKWHYWEWWDHCRYAVFYEEINVLDYLDEIQWA